MKRQGTKTPKEQGLDLEGFLCLGSLMKDGGTDERLLDAVRFLFLVHEGSGTDRHAGGLVEYSSAIAVQARTVQHLVPVKSEDEPLVRATPLVLGFAILILSLVRTRLGHFHYAPQLTRLTVFFVKVISLPEKANADEIHDHVSRLQPFENIYSCMTARAEKIRSPDGHITVMQIGRRTTLCAGHLHRFTFFQFSAPADSWQTVSTSRVAMNERGAGALDSPHRRS